MFNDLMIRVCEVGKYLSSSSNDLILIGFSGAGSTGKSSIAEALAADYNWQFVGSTSRLTFKRLGYTNEAAQRQMTEQQKFDLQMAIWQDYVTNFCDMVERATTSLVFDRTLADHFAYACFQCGSFMTEQVIKDCQKLTETQLRLFDAIFYAPYPPNFVSVDNFRDADYLKDTIVDAVIYKMLGVYISEELPMTNVASRVEFVKEYIEALTLESEILH